MEAVPFGQICNASGEKIEVKKSRREEEPKKQKKWNPLD
jgi:hypothetical protein